MRQALAEGDRQPADRLRDRRPLAFRVAGDIRAAAEGEYAVEIKMYRTPHYPNFRLSDYFFDRDYFSGVRAGAIQVAHRVNGKLQAPQGPSAPDETGGH